MVMYKTFLNQNSKSITFHLLLPLHLLVIFVPPPPQKTTTKDKKKKQTNRCASIFKKSFNPPPLIAPDPYTLQSQGGYEGASLKLKRGPASLKTRTG